MNSRSVVYLSIAVLSIAAFALCHSRSQNATIYTGDSTSPQDQAEPLTFREFFLMKSRGFVNLDSTSDKSVFMDLGNWRAVMEDSSLVAIVKFKKDSVRPMIEKSDMLTFVLPNYRRLMVTVAGWGEVQLVGPAELEFRLSNTKDSIEEVFLRGEAWFWTYNGFELRTSMSQILVHRPPKAWNQFRFRMLDNGDSSGFWIVNSGLPIKAKLASDTVEVPDSTKLVGFKRHEIIHATDTVEIPNYFSHKVGEWAMDASLPVILRNIQSWYGLKGFKIEKGIDTVMIQKETQEHIVNNLPFYEALAEIPNSKVKFRVRHDSLFVGIRHGSN